MIEFLTVAEVAATLRVSKMTIYRMVESGAIPSYKVGGSVRIDATALQQFVESAKVEVP